MENQGSDSALYAICGDAHRMQLFGDCDWNECESGMSLREDIMIEERGVPSRQLSFPLDFGCGPSLQRIDDTNRDFWTAMRLLAVSRQIA